MLNKELDAFLELNEPHALGAEAFHEHLQIWVWPKCTRDSKDLQPHQETLTVEAQNGKFEPRNRGRLGREAAWQRFARAITNSVARV